MGKKKNKLLVSVVVILLSIGFILFNTSIEDIIAQDASTSGNAPMSSEIADTEDNGVILIVYETTADNIGIAIIKHNQSPFNKYELLEITNVDNAYLSDIGWNSHYQHMGMDITYGVVMNPSDSVTSDLKSNYHTVSSTDYQNNVYILYISQNV